MNAIDQSTRKHLRAWCEDYAADEADNVERDMLAYLEACDEEDYQPALDRGWPKTYEYYVRGLTVSEACDSARQERAL